MELSPQRKKVVVLSSTVAIFGGLLPLLSQHHPKLALAWTAVMLLMLFLAIVEFVKLRRREQ